MSYTTGERHRGVSNFYKGDKAREKHRREIRFCNGANAIARHRWERR